MPNLFHVKVTNDGNILHSLCKHVWGKAVSYVRKEETVTTSLYIVLFSFFVWLYHDHCLKSVLKCWYHTVPQWTNLAVVQNQTTEGEMDIDEGAGNAKPLVSSGTHISFSQAWYFSADQSETVVLNRQEK